MKNLTIIVCLVLSFCLLSLNSAFCAVLEVSPSGVIPNGTNLVYTWLQEGSLTQYDFYLSTTNASGVAVTGMGYFPNQTFNCSNGTCTFIWTNPSTTGSYRWFVKPAAATWGAGKDYEIGKMPPAIVPLITFNQYNEMMAFAGCLSAFTIFMVWSRGL